MKIVQPTGPGWPRKTWILTIIIMTRISTCRAAKERTALDVRVIEGNTVAYDALRLHAGRSPFIAAHFLQQQTDNASIKKPAMGRLLSNEY